MMNDLISRQAAIDAICEDGTRIERQGRYSMTMVERKQRDIDILENLPSAQPERKRGKWEPKEALNVPYGIILECSECGFETLVNDALYFKFCPNCGADMRGGDNEVN